MHGVVPRAGRPMFRIPPTWRHQNNSSEFTEFPGGIGYVERSEVAGAQCQPSLSSLAALIRPSA
eukprot:2768903-Alexandrium_andersonii.AAC.1